MQNIPGNAIDTVTEQIQLVKTATASSSDRQSMTAQDRDDKHVLFADLFNEHTELVEDELAMAPVAHKEKMLDSAPMTRDEDDEEKTTSVAGTKASPEVEEEPAEKNIHSRMTQEDLNEVREDLKEYGMSDEEIAKIEERINSEEGLTWAQFASAIADKIAQMQTIQISGDQKQNLTSFFGKLGFSSEETGKLISQLENGDVDKVMKAVQAKIDAMPQDQQLLFSKPEIEAFTTALGFSQEFSNKVQELLGSNALPKDVKQAFTLIRQELAELDKKHQQLVRAVGKAFAGTMGDKHKQSSAARQIEAAVDLKPRVAEDQVNVEAKAAVNTEVKEEMAQAFRTRKDALPEATVRNHTQKHQTDEVDIKPEAVADAKDPEVDPDAENDQKWNNFFDKTREDAGQTGDGQMQQAKAEGVEAMGKNTLAQAQAKAADAKAWEKVSAPKVMKQVDEAVIKTLKNGVKQLTLQLTPENLGKLSIVLSVQGKEVGATIRAESHDAAKVIAENIDIIKNSLESQGLKVEKLEVQTGLSDNQSYKDWFGESEHNLSREREAMVAMRNHMRNMRKGNSDGVAQDMQLLREQAINADHGLHLIA